MVTQISHARKLLARRSHHPKLNIPKPVRVSFSLKEGKRKACLHVPSFLPASSSLFVFVSVLFDLGKHGCTSVAGGVNPGMGGGECCGTGICSVGHRASHLQGCPPRR
jgi:hypothetical protein